MAAVNNQVTSREPLIQNAMMAADSLPSFEFNAKS